MRRRAQLISDSIGAKCRCPGSREIIGGVEQGWAQPGGMQVRMNLLLLITTSSDLKTGMEWMEWQLSGLIY